MRYIQYYYILFITLVFLLPSKVWAGDPCPLNYTIYDYAVPPWLSRTKVLNSLKSQSRFVGITYHNKTEKVFITHVLANSPAQAVGLQVDDQIIAVNQQKIDQTSRLSQLLDQIPLHESLRFEIQRMQNTMQFVFHRSQSDPVINALHRFIEQQDCATVHIQTPTETQKKVALTALFTKNKRFRCKQAHHLLNQPLHNKQAGDLVIIRGSKRILITHIGYKTICIRSNKLDGESLTAHSISPLFDALTAKWRKERFSNP
jgi:hypothetical protein